MRRVPTGIPETLVLALLLAAPAGAEEKGAKPAPQAKAAKKAAPASTVDPAARAVLDRMGDYLQGLTEYSVHSETYTDEVCEGGAKLQFGGSVDVFRKGNRIRFDIRRDGIDDQQYFYDGKTLTVWVKAKNLYGSIPAASDPAEMVQETRRRGLTVPLDSLLREAVRKELLAEAVDGLVVGAGVVGGAECDHLAIHQADIDWQIWVEKGSRPLPRKLVITTLGDPKEPQHLEVLTWDLPPRIDESTFAFTPPEDAETMVIPDEPSPAATPPPVTKPAPKAKKAAK
jgi:hypothetical protein